MFLLKFRAGDRPAGLALGGKAAGLAALRSSFGPRGRLGLHSRPTEYSAGSKMVLVLTNHYAGQLRAHDPIRQTIAVSPVTRG